MRPWIGVTGPDEGGFPAWFLTSWAVRLAGGRPLRITPARGAPREPLAGLVLGGGADVDPRHYAPEPAPRFGEELARRPGRSRRRLLLGFVLSPALYLLRRVFSVRHGGFDLERDRLEVELLERAVRDGIPVLGICRGAQLLNVYFGGSLHRDITGFYVESPRPWTVFPRKDVRLEAESLLAEVCRSDRCFVNSLHRQAIDRVGIGLRVVAREVNGLVQAIEHPLHPFLVGVQWHPEYLPQRPEQRRLFRTMLVAARSWSAHPEQRVRSVGGLGALAARHQLGRDLAMPQEDGERVHETEHR